MSGTATITPGDTPIGQARTSIGTSDRGISLQWRSSAASAEQVSSATLSASQGWAAASATYSDSTPPPPGATGRSVIIGGAKRPVVTASVIVGGVKRPVTGAYVIVGGVKRPT